MKALVLLAAIAMSGCTALKTPESQAWLALHAVDTVQTFRIAHDPHCYEEDASITRRLIGPHPSDAEVAAWSIGSAAVHLGVTEFLLRNEHPNLAKAWQYVRIGMKVNTIADNHSIGIRIGSPNHHKTDCQESLPLPPPAAPPRPIG